jgi:hypothetical protein
MNYSLHFLKTALPDELINKIFLYFSHPNSDLIHQKIKNYYSNIFPLAFNEEFNEIESLILSTIEEENNKVDKEWFIFQFMQYSHKFNNYPYKQCEMIGIIEILLQKHNYFYNFMCNSNKYLDGFLITTMGIKPTVCNNHDNFSLVRDNAVGFINQTELGIYTVLEKVIPNRHHSIHELYWFCKNMGFKISGDESKKEYIDLLYPNLKSFLVI